MNTYSTNAERVVGEYGDLVYRIAYVKLASRRRSEVDDVFQDVFLTYIKKPPKAEPDSSSERAWFVRCTVNRCTDIFRGVKRRAETELDETVPYEDEAVNPALEALMSLPEKYRLPMYMRYVQGYGCDECAEMLGIGGSALRMRLERGKKLFERSYGITENFLLKEND